MQHTLPEALRAFLTITEIDNSDFFIRKVFARKFGHAPPDFPRHFAAFYRARDGGSFVAGYSHMRKFEDVYLSGGSCTDGDTIRMFSPEEKALVDVAGGIFPQILKYKLAKLALDCDAFFGHCGDRRAFEVGIAAGFEQTEYEHLLVHWHKILKTNRKQELTAKINAIGAF